MGREPGSQPRARHVAAGTLVALALLAGAAHARTWAQWSPAPLASDSAYAALAARPADSLGASERAWLAVQRDWRAQREEEQARPSSALTAFHPHPPRSADERFAALASRPFAALADAEIAWLVAENAAQRADRRAHEGGLRKKTLRTVLLATAVGVVAATMIMPLVVAHAL